MSAEMPEECGHSLGPARGVVQHHPDTQSGALSCERWSPGRRKYKVSINHGIRLFLAGVLPARLQGRRKSYEVLTGPSRAK